MSLASAVPAAWQPLPAPVPAALLGESPFWHPDEAALYWCDIPGKAIHRWQPETARHQQWSFDHEPGSLAPRRDGSLLVAFRDGLFVFDPASGQRRLLCPPPYDATSERFNDGKADSAGRFWVGTILDQRQPQAGLFCWSGGELRQHVNGITVSNGLAFSADGQGLWRSDTAAHEITRHTLGADGSLGPGQRFAQFEQRPAGAPLDDYAGRPDGAAMDAEGHYWVAMFEGQRLLRLAPDGRVVQTLMLPTRCPTMPCFGGPALKTLFVTTAKIGRSAEERAQQPLAGHVLSLDVAVPGLPVNFAQ